MVLLGSSSPCRITQASKVDSIQANPTLLTETRWFKRFRIWGLVCGARVKYDIAVWPQTCCSEFQHRILAYNHTRAYIFKVSKLFAIYDPWSLNFRNRTDFIDCPRCGDEGGCGLWLWTRCRRGRRRRDGTTWSMGFAPGAVFER